jgi:DNA-binding CsgD family transcriptional regulator
VRSNGHVRDWSDRFQEAALDPALWLTVLQELADATGSARAELVGFGSELTGFNWVTSADDRMFVDFRSAGAGSPDANFRVAADIGTPTMKIVAEDAYDVARRSVARQDYIDFCDDYRMPFGCQACLVRSDGALVGLSVLRARSEGRTGKEEQQVFAEAAAAAQAAVRLQRAIERKGFHLLSGTFEAIGLPCLLLDGLGIVRQITQEAERLIAGHPRLTLEDGRLSSPEREFRRRIDRALIAVLGPARQAHERVPGYGEGPVPPLVIDLFRLPDQDWTMRFAPRAILVLRDRRISGDAEARLLAAFGLTPAETQVALALAAGQCREAIAAARSVSMETLRAQVKSLYQKTGCRRETELALMVKALLD